MNWRTSLFVVMLTVMTVFALAGCEQAQEIVPATEQLSPAINQPNPVGEQTANTDNGTRPAPSGDIAPGDRPSAPAMDLAAAAAKLGVTEQQLSEALGDLSQGPLNLATAVEKLGVSEEALREALGFTEGVPPTGGPSPDGSPPDGPPPAGSGLTGQGQ